MAPSEQALNEASKSSFPDLAGYDWAAKYINYASAKGIISGYPNGTFGPAGQVTYAELASMLVRALGFKAEDLTGTWPDNFITKASTLGIFTDIDNQVDNVNASALRGHVALMTYRVADAIMEANKPDGSTDPEEEPSEDPAGFLADFSGRAYGILLNTAKVLNEKGDAVDEYEFLIGDKTLYIQTNGKVATDSVPTIEGHLMEGDLYALQMSNGVVTKFGTSDDGFFALNSPAGFEDLTDDGSGGAWAKVEDAKNYVIETDFTYAGRKVFSVLEDASIYVAIVENGAITGYKPGTFRDIKADYYVRLYSVTGDDPGVVEVVVVSEWISKK